MLSPRFSLLFLCLVCRNTFMPTHRHFIVQLHQKLRMNNKSPKAVPNGLASLHPTPPELLDFPDIIIFRGPFGVLRMRNTMVVFAEWRENRTMLRSCSRVIEYILSIFLQILRTLQNITKNEFDLITKILHRNIAMVDNLYERLIGICVQCSVSHNVVRISQR